MPQLPIGPDITSSDYDSMLGYWDLADTILAGVDAMREAGVTFLPRFTEETEANYEYRRANAKFTNIFRDIVENLAAKPFAQECHLIDPEKLPERVREISEDVDGRGNHLHVFAASTFFNGIAKTVDWILIDHTKVPAGATQAEERAAGARPYWVRVPVENLVAVYSDLVNGKEEIVHARILEPTVERVGWTEVNIERVRVLDRARLVSVDEVTGVETVTYAPATFTVYEKVLEEPVGRRKPVISWQVIDEGPISIGIIPLVPFITGRRQQSSWRILPALKDCADLQIEHYQAETNLKCAKERTCFPMIAGNGISPDLDKNNKALVVPTGPGAVLYAPMHESGQHGEWVSLEPGAQSLKFLADDLKEMGKQLRELGRQPLTADSGNLTVVTTAFAAQKGNSAAQAWALNLKDALERAWEITCMWLKESAQPEVFVFTDFSIETEDGSSMARLIDMAKAGKLSDLTLWHEGKRRGELSAEFDADEEEQRLRDQGPDPASEADLAAAVPKRKPANNNRPGPRKKAA